MGVTFLKLKITNPARPKKKSRVLKFLVDSGAVYSVVPQSISKQGTGTSRVQNGKSGTVSVRSVTGGCPLICGFAAGASPRFAAE